MLIVENKTELDSDVFWQRLLLPEEDRRHLLPWDVRVGGYRWFRSNNVVDLEKHRRLRARKNATR